ncbi:MAG: hypothetical protein E7394_03930 [Ruminococcaceae bacterium]|nr:hypothetical protein [Oscillospiraceae bacterium]
MKKLFLMLTLVFAIVFSSSGVIAFEFSALSVKDTDRHWAENDINELFELGVMKGYDGNVNPDQNITRGEFAALLSRAFIIEKNRDYSFLDITSENIFYDCICALTENSIISGYTDGTFRPDAPVTREEIVIMISRIAGNENSYPIPVFSDIKKDYIWKSELAKVTGDGVISGFPDGSFRPKGYATRAQCASIILSAMKAYIPKGDESEIINSANLFLNNHFSNIHENLSGSAKDESEYVKETYKKAEELGYSVTNHISNILYPKMNQSGPFTVMEANYDVSVTINGQTKKYKGYSEIKLLTIGNVTKVYSHTRGIKKNYPINLTWEVFSSPPSYETPGVTTVSPTCFRVSSEKRSNEVVTEMYDENGKGLFFNSSLKQDYIDYAKSRGYEVWAMYKTDFKTYTASLILNSNTMRKQASDKLLEYILTFGLDGINFDFENMYEKDRGAYTNHVKEIAIMAHTLGATISVCVNRFEPTSSTWSMCYDRNALGKICDYVALMAYDQYSSGSRTPGPVAGMQWTEYCINTTLNEVKGEKLLLGMPYYIRYWEVKNSKAVKSYTFSMKDAINKINLFNIMPEYDGKYMLNKYKWTDGEKEYVMWMENADTIKNRVILSKRYNLAGVASWRRGFETEDVWYGIESELYR